MKKRKKLRLGIIAILCFTMCMFTVVLAEPGTEDDPLISKSYIENQVIPRLEQYIESRISEIKSEGSTGSTAETFIVVEATAGQEIICNAGAELILRMGKATIIATEKGGIADTTAGYDLADGTDMPSNHLLIVPVSDGRGIKAQENVIVMIKGEYTVK